MNPCCLICNTKTGVSLRSAAIILFGEHTTLPSGRKLPEVVSDIIDKPVVKDNVHSDVICKKCCKTCTDYDSLQIKLVELKNEIQQQFKKSLTTNNLSYDNYTAEVKTLSKKKEQADAMKTLKKLVLPASKLQPLPPDMLRKVRQLPMATRTINMNKKFTTGTSVLKPAVKQTDKQNSIYTITEDIESVITSKSNTSLSPIKSNFLSLDLNSLPKVRHLQNGWMEKKKNVQKMDGLYEDLSSMLLSKIQNLADLSNMASLKDGQEIQDKSNEDNEMEIDEVFALSVVPETNENGELVFEVEGLKEDEKDTEEYLDMGMLESVASSSGDDNFIVSKLRILNDDDTRGDDDDDDSHSNDESQIELQVSGDAETANAIIAAAQERGGAFLKVESGKMYRVKSVENKVEKTGEKPLKSMPIVAFHRDGFKCLICERNKAGNDKEVEFVSNGEMMMRHLKNVHDARTYICQLCNAVMRKRSEYTLHIADHAKRLKLVPASNCRTHECSVCHKVYGSRTLLNEHMNMHNGQRPYVCLLCHKAFASKYTHQAHLKTHSVRPRPYECSQCKKTFLTQQNLSQHEKTHSGTKDFVCHICLKAFSTQHNLEVHAVVHSGERPFVCSVCNKAFARRAECKDHMRIHTGERPFACDICGARFAQNSNLHSHKRATHLDDRRYQCDHCTKKFKRKRLLEYHIKASHTGERPLVCEVCNSTFVYPEHYKKHLRIHTGERPYACEICGKTFNSADNRNTHRFVHSEKKLYECVTCGAGFMRKQLLYAHINANGHTAESIVVNGPHVTKAIENSTATQYIEGTVEQIKITTEPSTATIFEGGHELVLDATQPKCEEDDIPKFFVTTDSLSDQTEILTNDENGATMRLIQIKLPDGNDGWVAVNGQL